MRRSGLCVSILSAIVALSLIIGCSYKSIEHGTEITDEQVLAIENGKSSKEEIIVEFGDPSKIMNDGRIFFYTWTRGAKSSFFGMGSGTAHTKSLVVVFDENDVVKTHKITRGSTDEQVGIGD